MREYGHHGECAVEGGARGVRDADVDDETSRLFSTITMTGSLSVGN